MSGSRSPQPASLVGTGTLRKMAYPAEMQLQPVPGEGLPEYYLRCAARENRSQSICVHPRRGHNGSTDSQLSWGPLSGI